MYNAPSQLDAAYYQQQEQLKKESLKSRLQTRIPYYIPVIGWLPEYSWKQDFAKDLVAGLGVAAMLIPQSLAYALLAGLPPHIGLYTAFVRSYIYSVMTLKSHCPVLVSCSYVFLFGHLKTALYWPRCLVELALWYSVGWPSRRACKCCSCSYLYGTPTSPAKRIKTPHTLPTRLA